MQYLRKELRFNSKEILHTVSRGKPYAKIVPLKEWNYFIKQETFKP